MMKHWISLRCCLLGIGLGLLAQACLKKPASSVTTQDFPLEVTGRIEASSGLPASEVMVFVEQEPAPEVISDAEGRFRFTWNEERLKTLRLRYHPERLRLYFVRNGTSSEGAVFDRIYPVQIGMLDIGVIRLQPDRELSGFVFATRPLETGPSPVSGAKVRIGRQEVLTDAQGRFVARAPQLQVLPVLIEKKGYVQTRSLWEARAAGETRDFTLYDRLAVRGTASLPQLLRSANPTEIPNSIPLAFETNALASLVRVSADRDALERDPGSVNLPWRSIEDSIRVPVPINGPVVYYYQFADASRTLLSDIASITVDFAASPLAPATE